MNSFSTSQVITYDQQTTLKVVEQLLDLKKFNWTQIERVQETSTSRWQQPHARFYGVPKNT